MVAECVRCGRGAAGRRAKSFLLVSGCLTDSQVVGAGGRVAWCSWVQMEPGQVDRVVDVYRMALLPVMQVPDGFCSASLLVDRASGFAVSSVTYDSLEATERSREKADALREAGAREARVDIVEVCEFELVLAHLRVPELA